jgi:competence protein ComEA
LRVFKRFLVKNDKLNVLWLIATGVLILIIVAFSLAIWLRSDKGQLIIVSAPQSPQIKGEVYIDGAVSSPGIYPLKSGDSLESILQASGGMIKDADVSRIYLYISSSDSVQSGQKIDINRADAWLLEALPTIGEVKAQAICDYRKQNGPFRNIEEITHVPGINNTTFEKIKGLITVAEFH